MENYCPDDCGICRKQKEICFYSEKNLSFQCPICKEFKSPHDIYEYRGSECCPECVDTNKENQDLERQEVINESNHKTDRFKGLDLSDSKIGKVNKELLKGDIEIAKKESLRLKNYENKAL